ncbi:hypothetical protein CAEBREN_25845 [Caenorhabditis brenneri]|uniref:Uncharacterized protein n=1 Tax=Caenorhabditis brenneri TaxID=135651 RepID=G0M977_CAEBE|nr:hypothetical protein CAEBREN_25845 [Caenorhabditis brenneri]
MAPQTTANVSASISKSAQSPLIKSGQQRKVAMAKHNMCGIEMPLWKDKKLSQETESFSASGAAHRQKLAEGARIVLDEMKAHFPESKVTMTGSSAAGVDIATSDLDFTMKDPTRLEETKFEKLMAIRNVLREKSTAFEKLFVTKGHTPVLQLVTKVPRVEIDVTIDNETPIRNTHLLANYGKVDARFPQLCRVIKHWAAETGVEDSRNERLNSFSVCLLLIHYLQSGVTPAVLPNLQAIFPEYNGEYEVGTGAFQDWDLLKELEGRGVPLGQNTSSVGALLQGFFKFYATFDFKNQWISIKRGTALEKKRDDQENPLEGLPDKNWCLVVEDPFLETPWNCGRTLQQMDTLERVQEEFRLAEEIIRQSHRLPFKKSIQLLRIEAEGRAKDMEIEEVESFLRSLEISRQLEESGGIQDNWDNWSGEQKEWNPNEEEPIMCPSTRIERQRPGSFWEEKKTVYRPWPEIRPKVSFDDFDV